MRFEISLLLILFARTSLGQESGPVQCSNSRFYHLFPGLQLILQTPNPIGSEWDAVILFLDGSNNLDVYRIGFNFDTPVEVHIENRGNRTELTYKDFNENQINIYKSHYVYELRGQNFQIFKIFVQNLHNNITPNLTSISINEEGDSCLFLKIIPYETIHQYKVIPTQQGERKYYLDNSNEGNSEAQDLVSYIKDSYAISIVSLHNEQDSASSTSCGKRSKIFTYLITSGYATEPGDWPWHAALFHTTPSGYDYKCGGSLITSKAILTAAHCLYEGSIRVNRNRLVVKLGLHDRNITDPHVQDFEVQQMFIHENFEINTTRNDIAILQLGAQPVLNAFVQPVCLWHKDKIDIRESEGNPGYVIGWGLNEHHQYADILAVGRMLVVSHAACLDRHNNFYGQFLNSNTFCAGYRNSTSVCNGDSGGGMFFRDPDGTYRIRGIVSLSMALGDSTCNPYEYVVFTNVAQYLDWIKKKIAKEF